MPPLAIPQAMQRYTGCQLAFDFKSVKLDPVSNPEQQDELDLGHAIPLKRLSEKDNDT